MSSSIDINTWNGSFTSIPDFPLDEIIELAIEKQCQILIAGGRISCHMCDELFQVLKDSNSIINKALLGNTICWSFHGTTTKYNVGDHINDIIKQIQTKLGITFTVYGKNETYLAKCLAIDIQSKKIYWIVRLNGSDNSQERILKCCDIIKINSSSTTTDVITSQVSKDNVYVISIGTNYVGSKYNNLLGIPYDPPEMASLIFNNVSNHVTQILNKDVTSQNIKTAIELVVNNENCKLLIFHFSGHGSSNGQLVMHSGENISHTYLWENFSKFTGNRACVAIFACCYSGAMYKSINPFATTDITTQQNGVDFSELAKEYFNNKKQNAKLKTLFSTSTSSSDPNLLVWNSSTASQVTWEYDPEDIGTTSKGGYYTWRCGHRFICDILYYYKNNLSYSALWNKLPKSVSEVFTTTETYKTKKGKTKTTTSKKTYTATPTKVCLGNFNEEYTSFTYSFQEESSSSQEESDSSEELEYLDQSSLDTSSNSAYKITFDLNGGEGDVNDISIEAEDDEDDDSSDTIDDEDDDSSDTIDDEDDDSDSSSTNKNSSISQSSLFQKYKTGEWIVDPDDDATLVTDLYNAGLSFYAYFTNANLSSNGFITSAKCSNCRRYSKYIENSKFVDYVKTSKLFFIVYSSKYMVGNSDNGSNGKLRKQLSKITGVASLNFCAYPFGALYINNSIFYRHQNYQNWFNSSSKNALKLTNVQISTRGEVENQDKVDESATNFINLFKTAEASSSNSSQSSSSTQYETGKWIIDPDKNLKLIKQLITAGNSVFVLCTNIKVDSNGKMKSSNENCSRCENFANRITDTSTFKDYMSNSKIYFIMYSSTNIETIDSKMIPYICSVFKSTNSKYAASKNINSYPYGFVYKNSKNGYFFSPYTQWYGSDNNIAISTIKSNKLTNSELTTKIIDFIKTCEP